jgi:hypothetical protein
LCQGWGCNQGYPKEGQQETVGTHVALQKS